MGRAKSAVVIGLILLGGGWAAHSWYANRPKRPPDGVLVGTSPEWGGLDFGRYTAYESLGSNQVIPLGSLDITGRVLAVRQYAAEGFGERVHTDLVLGWESMSDNRVLDHLRIRQQDRGMDIEIRPPAVISAQEAYRTAINLSVYSNFDAMGATLDSIAVGDVVHMVGWRMRIRNAQGVTWEGGSGREAKGQGVGVILVLKLQVNGQKKFGNW